jgi:hypothetical protein
VRAIAWKAQTRLCQRYRSMMARGKPKQVVVTAIARELAGFVWSIACITSAPPAKGNVVTTSNDAITTYVNTLSSEGMIAPNDAINTCVATLSSESTITPDGARQVQQITLDTGRSRAPRSQPLNGVPRRAERGARTKTTPASVAER